MHRILSTVAVAVSLSAAAFGQSKGRVPAPGNSENVLIVLSRASVDTEIGKDMVVVTDGETLTPTGLMGVAEVKGRWDSVELASPVVRIEGDEAFVTGRVVFKGRPTGGRATKVETPLRIRYVRENGDWKLVDGCLGVCGSE
jgi:hypothetical protein